MSHDPWLLTPGPLTTSLTVKQAMLHDWGSRDANFMAINARMRERLVAMIGGEGTFTCVPMQGPGTFAVEAMVNAFVPVEGKLLVLVNGAYGKRIVRMCGYSKRAVTALEWGDDQPVDPARVAKVLAEDAAITHVAIVHCETTSGILNPVPEVARVVADAGRKLLIDSMSAFGAIELDSRKVLFQAVAASANKCLEGVPGLSFVLARIDALKESQGRSPSLALDLYDQWQALERTGQYRFTPPIHCIAAFDQALTEHEAEGGVAGRGARYRNNWRTLIDGMRALGFEALLPEHLQAPIIVTFLMPADPRFHFQTFYDKLKDRGYVIYPGKLTVADSFRIGCIGRLDESHMKGALNAFRAAMAEMGVKSGSPLKLSAE
ncbi:MAG TPA: 2-aminoethylphosphonate--pyruvate transaminase [Dongiaceae bacterium]|jgi:2-aminoethylphosphonate-pyruvate transaminase|nr:2-aminoethylphosphonate--pyruvate transaminase [Dongiaceae bacterium]